MRLEVANVSGQMLRAGDHLRMQLDVETMFAARPVSPTADAQPECATVLIRPTAEQVEQLAVQLASTRLQQWGDQKVRLQRIRTQLTHTQDAAFNKMSKQGYTLPPNIVWKTWWSELAQEKLVEWLTDMSQPALQDAPILDAPPQASEEAAVVETSDDSSSDSDSSSDDDEEGSQSDSEAAAGTPPRDDPADSVGPPAPSMEQVLAENQHLRDTVSRLEAINRTLEYEKDQMQEELNDLRGEYGQLVRKLTDLRKAQAASNCPPAKKPRFE